MADRCTSSFDAICITSMYSSRIVANVNRRSLLGHFQRLVLVEVCNFNVKKAFSQKFLPPSNSQNCGYENRYYNRAEVLVFIELLRIQ